MVGFPYPGVGQEAISALDTRLEAARLAPIADIAGTYNATAKTITAAGNGALAAQDGVAVVKDDRLALMNQATATLNGVWVATDLGSATSKYVLTRAADFDTTAEIVNGLQIEVEEGTVNGGKIFEVTAATIILDTDDPLFVEVMPKSSLATLVDSSVYAATSDGAFDTTLTIPGNVLSQGSYVKCRAVVRRTIEDQLAHTMTLKGLVGQSECVVSAPISVPNLETVVLEFWLLVRGAIGATAAVVGGGTVNAAFAGLTLAVTLPSGQTADTTGPLTIGVNCQWSDAANGATLELLIAEIIK